MQSVGLKQRYRRLCLKIIMGAKDETKNYDKISKNKVKNDCKLKENKIQFQIYKNKA